MAIRLRLVLAPIAAMALATSAQGCRVALSPAQRLESGYHSGAISAVALARVTRSGYTGAHFSDAHPWRASARVLRIFRGSYPHRNISFDRGWGSAACDDGRPPPGAGALWVIYFWTRGPNDQPVWMSYPADVAFAVDPLLPRKAR